MKRSGLRCPSSPARQIRCSTLDPGGKVKPVRAGRKNLVRVPELLSSAVSLTACR